MVSAFYIFTRHSSSLNLQYLIHEYMKTLLSLYYMGFLHIHVYTVSVILLNLAVIVGFPTSSSMHSQYMNYGIDNTCNNDE